MEWLNLKKKNNLTQNPSEKNNKCWIWTQTHKEVIKQSEWGGVMMACSCLQTCLGLCCWYIIDVVAGRWYHLKVYTNVNMDSVIWRSHSLYYYSFWITRSDPKMFLTVLFFCSWPCMMSLGACFLIWLSWAQHSSCEQRSPTHFQTLCFRQRLMPRYNINNDFLNCESCRAGTYGVGN